MDDLEVQRTARAYVARAGVFNPGDYSQYLNEAKAKLKRESLGKGESGYTITKPSGEHVIFVNSDEIEERQNFTICHEIAHIALGLSSNHAAVPSWAFAKRDENERQCDLFAAELLMPVAPFKSKVPTEEPSLSVIERLASDFHVSFPAAASRYAALAPFPCAYVTMEKGFIRYAERSTSLRRINAWIKTRTAIPGKSTAHRLREAKVSNLEVDEVAQDLWFENWEPDLSMFELARHYQHSDTTVAVLWFSEEDAPEKECDRFGRVVHDDGGLPELTGELPWPGNKKRR